MSERHANPAAGARDAELTLEHENLLQKAAAAKSTKSTQYESGRHFLLALRGGLWLDTEP
jgi:hypothetical protein